MVAWVVDDCLQPVARVVHDEPPFSSDTVTQKRRVEGLSEEKPSTRRSFSRCKGGGIKYALVFRLFDREIVN